MTYLEIAVGVIAFVVCFGIPHLLQPKTKPVEEAPDTLRSTPHPYRDPTPTISIEAVELPMCPKRWADCPKCSAEGYQRKATFENGVMVLHCAGCNATRKARPLDSTP